MPEIASLLLAAGRGTRFGVAPKLLAKLDGRPLVRHAAEAALAARPRPIIAVLGAHGQEVGAALEGLELTTVHNRNFAEGLSTSLQAGIEALPSRCSAVVVILGDMPRVTGPQINGLVAAFLASASTVSSVVPVHGGRRGNPVLLNLDLLRADIASLRGDRGAGPLLAARRDVLELPGAPETSLDIDTPEALAALVER
jgi:molybdenum cofactor cytidylyltransferase